MADYLVTDTELTSIANAIRTKGGTSAALEWPTGFVDAINAISGGGGATLYSINNEFSSYVSVDKQSAEEGETVTATLVTNPPSQYSGGVSAYNAGSIFARLFTVNAGKGSSSAGDTATFTMPGNDVTIRFVG